MARDDGEQSERGDRVAREIETLMTDHAAAYALAALRRAPPRRKRIPIVLIGSTILSSLPGYRSRLYAALIAAIPNAEIRPLREPPALGFHATLWLLSAGMYISFCLHPPNCANCGQAARPGKSIAPGIPHMSIRFARSSICSRLKNVPSPDPGQVSQIFFHDDGLSRCEFQNGQVRHWTGLAL